MARTKRRQPAGLFDTPAPKKLSMKDRLNKKRKHMPSRVGKPVEEEQVPRPGSVDDPLQHRRVCLYCHTELIPTEVSEHRHRQHHCPSCDISFPWLEDPVINGAINEMHYTGEGFSVLSMRSDPESTVFEMGTHYAAGRERTSLFAGPTERLDGILFDVPPDEWEGHAFVYEITREAGTVIFTPIYRWHAKRKRWLDLRIRRNK